MIDGRYHRRRYQNPLRAHGRQQAPLLLCHGFTDSGRTWQRLVLALKNDYDCITPDARGHGFSEAPRAGYGAKVMADDAAGLVEALDLRHITVLGHSMGAATASLLAVRHPHLVRCLVLEDPGWRDQETSAEERIANAERQRFLIMGWQGMTLEEIISLQISRNPATRLWDATDLSIWAEAKKQVDVRVTEVMGTARPRWQETVSLIPCPTLLVTGDPARGAIVTPDVAAQAATRNASIQVVNIPGAAHSIHRDSFDQYIAVVGKFRDTQRS